MNRNTKRWILDTTVWAAGVAAIVLLITDTTGAERETTMMPDIQWQTERAGRHPTYTAELLGTTPMMNSSGRFGERTPRLPD